MLRAFLAAAAFTLGTPTAAAVEVVWRCELSGDLVRLHCAAAESRSAVASPPTADRTDAGPADAAARDGGVMVRGTRFPLDPARPWVVELWSPPSEAAFVELLARATICYRSPRCRVHVDLQALERAAR